MVNRCKCKEKTLSEAKIKSMIESQVSFQLLKIKIEQERKEFQKQCRKNDEDFYKSMYKYYFGFGICLGFLIFQIVSQIFLK